jgi:NTP pyrophosphatase (non-canonical NTP hydrolase)
MSIDLDWKYAEFVRSRKKDPDAIGPFDQTQNDLLHMILGIAGEAGELVDAVKKHVIYDKDLDLDNVIEELGDLEFYLEGFRDALGLERQFIVKYNMIKLTERYPVGYSNKDAIERKDKK